MGMKVNTSLFKADIEKYIAKTNLKLEKVLDDVSEQIKTNQQDILDRSVKNGTGNLESSIDIIKEKNDRKVGPDLNKAPYAPYVEYGHHSFTGYHYVRDSIYGVQLKYEQEIKRAL